MQNQNINSRNDRKLRRAPVKRMSIVRVLNNVLVIYIIIINFQKKSYIIIIIIWHLRKSVVRTLVIF